MLTPGLVKLTGVCLSVRKFREQGLSVNMGYLSRICDDHKVIVGLYFTPASGTEAVQIQQRSDFVGSLSTFQLPHRKELALRGFC